MTALWKNRKVRRYVDAAISGNGKPKGWPQTAPLRPHVEGVERGSAKPGRGGRRKRQRRAATTRAALEWLAAQATGRPSFSPRRCWRKRPDRPTWRPPLGRREAKAPRKAPAKKRSGQVPARSEIVSQRGRGAGRRRTGGHAPSRPCRPPHRNSRVFGVPLSDRATSGSPFGHHRAFDAAAGDGAEEITVLVDHQVRGRPAGAPSPRFPPPWPAPHRARPCASLPPP